MNKYLSAIVLLSVLTVMGCSENTVYVPESDLVVIRGYLYASEPVTEIQLTATLGLGSEDSAAPPINDAEVVLIRNGNRYPLQPTPDREGYYHYPGTALSVETGDVFNIEVSYFGKLATAETVVPPPPVGAAVYPEELVIQSFSSGDIGFGKRFFQDDTTALQVNWLNQDGSTYYLTLDNLDPDPQPVNTGLPFARPGRFISLPTNGDEFRVTRMNVTHLGRHRVKIYRVNREYADLYMSGNQDSRDLNEPLTNIANGLGVFAAFNSDSVFFRVVQ
ncbi:MAG: DUF4249 family protein [Gemmatimonadota bacterium]|nr:DUF4249 family protein [Gemmatimonadota bacterium]